MGHVSLWPVLVLVLIHLLGSRLRFLHGFPRSVWLSGAGGVSVAYVFMHLFPELHEGQEHMEENVFWAEEFLKHHVYLVALIGLATFYGLERSVVSAKRELVKKDSRKVEAPKGVFWVHIGSFALYNAIIGYVLFQREETPSQSILLFTIAMALHFLVNDYALQEHHKETYRKYGQWVLVLALLLGWSVGYIQEVNKTTVFILTAFIGGGVILNVLKEELPEERESRYWAFLLGAGAYAILLLSL
ncbi:hypothetical protein DXT99_13330 [Pontibacter diazotrophicus]|uniref:ZIP Zinc transporter n=1 Tax=Pontibacter diazotrophicus TaxID=1400979 RepID=A0A3D8LB70_9BACT|nr:hypothetical protein [Pontibacter diazotrophicus]RDV14645.1 hypothetical protein DXT99_13330 [Pontibacter diazotrophicus]